MTELNLHLSGGIYFIFSVLPVVGIIKVGTALYQPNKCETQYNSFFLLKFSFLRNKNFKTFFNFPLTNHHPVAPRMRSLGQ